MRFSIRLPLSDKSGVGRLTFSIAIVGLGHVVFPLLAEVAGAGTTAGLWIGICAGAELLRT
jgi:hypothetical protein